MLGVAGLSGGEKFDGFEGASLALVFLGGIAAGLWLLAFGLRWFASMPKLPAPGAKTSDLGSESPAVVNLLVNRWRLSHLAVQATLVDLAARGLLEIEMYGRQFVVRLQDDRAGIQQPSATYERQLLDLVRARATGGSAPVEALDLGEAGEAASWLKRFNKSVVSEARKAGLARSRWSRADWVVLGGGLFVVLQLFALAFGVAHLGEGTGSSGDEFDRWDWLFVAGAAWFLGMVVFGSMRDLRDTPKGKTVCAGWLGVREYLKESNAFEEASLASVTIWERYLSYAVAMGAAHDAVESLPLVADDPNAAWTRFGGHWREVRINYPIRFGFGQSPIRVFLGGLWRTAVWGGLAFVVLPIVVPILFDLIDTITTDLAEVAPFVTWIVFAVVAIVGGWSIFLAVRLFDGVVRLWRGAADLNKVVVVEGEVVRVAEGRVAVADKDSEEVNAWFAPLSGPGLSRGMIVRYERSPRLWYVTKVEVLSRPGERSIDVAAEESGPDAGVQGNTLGVVNRIMGREMHPTSAPVGEFDLAFAAGRSEAFGDNVGNRVVVAVIDLPPFLAGRMEAFINRATAGSSGNLVLPGGGRWVGGNALVVRNGSRMTTIQVTLPGELEAVAREKAEAIAAALASQAEQRSDA